MEAPLTGGLGQGSHVTQGAREAGVSRSGLGALLGWGVGSVCVTRFVAPRKALPLPLDACYRVAIHGGGVVWAVPPVPLLVAASASATGPSGA